MSRWEDMGLRILAQYERRRTKNAAAPGETVTYNESLRVDGQGLIPRSGPNYSVQISIKDDPAVHRFPLPPEFNKQKFFVIRAANLPVQIPYDSDTRISIIETDRKGEKILAQSPLRYRTA